MRLEHDQYELLSKFVEAHGSSPRESRGSFIAVESHNEPQATFIHSRVQGLAFKGSISDAEILADAGFLRKSHGPRGELVFAVLPSGVDAFDNKNVVSARSLESESATRGQGIEKSTEQVPVEISESLQRFRTDHPDPRKVAFLIMRFGDTAAHEMIVKGVGAALKPMGLTVVRADHKQYHDDLFPNIRTYIHGCGFGVAVFERIETDDFNPNVALEVGYMLALGKPVCLLKDRTLKTLHTDLVGKLYRIFDAYNPVETIPQALTRWLKDKGLPEK